NYLEAPAGLACRIALSILGQPFGELPSQQLAKQCSDTDTGEKVSVSAGSVPFFFIISINRTIESHFHEAGKREWPTNCYLRTQFIGELVHRATNNADSAPNGADLATNQTGTANYGENRRVLQFDVRAKGVRSAPFLGQQPHVAD